MPTTALDKSSNVVHTDRFLLDTLYEGDVLKVTMNRYRPVNTPRLLRDPGLILIFAHGMGFHKEHWEPTIHHLFRRDGGNKGPNRILEAWAVDYPSHGEAAWLNEEVIYRKPRPLTIYSYRNAIVDLCRSGLLGRLEKDVQKVVLIGHSAGSVGITLAVAALIEHPDETPVHRVILVDPTLWTPEVAGRMTDTYRIVEKTTPSRRSTWESKKAAYEWFKTRLPWSTWDDRVLKLYAEYGLRTLPDRRGVVLRCNPVHEAATFTEISTVYSTIEQLDQLCGVLPFHLIFGARCDMFSRLAQDTITNPTTGRVFASVTRVKGAGHMIVQEKPAALGDSLYSILDSSESRRKLQRMAKL